MKRPAVYIYLCYIAGVLVKLYLNHHMAMIGIIAIIIIAIVIDVRAWRYLLVFVCLFFFGFLNITRVIQQTNIIECSDNKQYVQIEGSVHDIDYSDNTIICKIKKVILNDKTKATNFKVLIKCNKIHNIHVGDYIEGNGTLRNYLKPTNPGGFNAINYYYSQQIYYNFYCNEVKNINSPKVSFRRIIYFIGISFEQQLHKIFPNVEASILCTMLLGTNLDQNIKSIYQLAGISHLLAISGLHITIIGIGFFNIIKKLIHIKFATSLTIVMLIVYTLMTGCSASATRASIMLTLMLLTVFYDETYDSLSAIFLAGFLMLIINPYQILDIGYQLSFSAVLGIVLLTPIIQQKFFQQRVLPTALSECHLFLDIVKNNLFVSLGATITTLPIISIYFYVIPTYALIINLLVVPVASIIIGFSILALSISFINFDYGCFIGGTVCFALRFIELCCLVVKQLPYHSIPIGQPKPYLILVYYLFLYLGSLKHHQIHLLSKVSNSPRYIDKEIPTKYHYLKLKVNRRFIGIFSSVIIVAYILFKVILPYYEMKITFLDVGQGDGAVIECYNKVFLIDGGGEIKGLSQSPQNIGYYTLKPYLASQGINHINGIFVSHSDFDHIYGIIEIIEMVETDFIVLPKVYENHINPDYLLKDLIEKANKKKIKVYYFATGDTYQFKDLNITCLYPNIKSKHSRNNNSNSLVLQASYKSFDALFTGDIEIEQEKALLEKSFKQVEILKVPHHGSDTSSSEEFINQFSPQVAVFSYGKSNNFGHPSKTIVNRYKVKNIVDYHIAETGAVILRTNGNKYYINTYLSRRKDKYICNN